MAYLDKYNVNYNIDNILSVGKMLIGACIYDKIFPNDNHAKSYRRKLRTAIELFGYSSGDAYRAARRLEAYLKWKDSCPEEGMIKALKSPDCVSCLYDTEALNVILRDYKQS